MTTKREYGSGGISWLGPRKVRLRVYVEGARRTRVVTIAHPKDHGGRKDASAALAAFRAEMETPLAAETVRTFGDVIEAYMVHRADQGMRRGTLENYQHMVDKRLPDELKAMDVTQVTPWHIDALYTSLRQAKYASTSVRQTAVLISGALANAERWEWIAQSPAKRVEWPKATPAKRPKLTPADVWILIRDAGTVDPVLAMALFMLVITGTRRGELCGLRWDDIDLEQSCIHIARQWIAGKGGQYIAPLKSDTGADEDGVRTVYTGPSVVDVIERYRTMQRDLHQREPDGWLISYDGGVTPMRAKSLAAAVSERARLSGMAGVTTHSFRKVTANELVAAGVDVDAAARRMGHTSQVMLRDYVKGSDERAVAASAALEARLVDQGLPMTELFVP